MLYIVNNLSGDELIAVSDTPINVVSEFYCCNEISKIEVDHYCIDFTDVNGHIVCSLECDSEIDAITYANLHFKSTGLLV